MVGLSSNDALSRLNSITTKEELISLIELIDVEGNGKSKTIFFSGSDEVTCDMVAPTAIQNPL